MTHIIDKIDPWACMPALVLIESLKFMSDESSPVATHSTTVDGFQPMLGNLLLIDEPMMDPVVEQLHQVLDRHNINKQLGKSWAVSYNKNGKQLRHRHCDENDEEKLSGVICLMGSRQGGELCFFDNCHNLQQGDVVIFKSNEVHWTAPTQYPKVIIAFDLI